MAGSTRVLDGTVYVVRHARAGRRTSADDDALRPLSKPGRRQADRIAEILGPVVSGTIVSSPYVRCVQTVLPLATRLDSEVAVADALAEGADPDGVIRLLGELPDGSVACGHGDLLSELAGRLEVSGCRVDDPISSAKGVVWAIGRTGGRLVHLRVLLDPGSS